MTENYTREYVGLIKVTLAVILGLLLFFLPLLTMGLMVLVLAIGPFIAVPVVINTIASPSGFLEWTGIMVLAALINIAVWIPLKRYCAFLCSQVEPPKEYGDSHLIKAMLEISAGITEVPVSWLHNKGIICIPKEFRD